MARSYLDKVIRNACTTNPELNEPLQSLAKKIEASKNPFLYFAFGYFVKKALQEKNGDPLRRIQEADRRLTPYLAHHNMSKPWAYVFYAVAILLVMFSLYRQI